MTDSERILAAFQAELRDLAWEGEILERTPTVTRRCSAGTRVQEVVAFELDSASADSAIRDEVNRAQGLGVALEWKAFSFDEPGDLVSRLESAGFSVGEQEAMVVYDLSRGLGKLDLSASADVHRITNEDELVPFKLVSESAFRRDDTDTVARLAEELRADRTGHTAYLAYDDGTPAAVGRLYINGQSAFAGLYGGGTAPDRRGRGLYQAVVSARARDAFEAGARYLLVDALPTSLPILLGLGFVHVADTWPCSWKST